MIDKVAVAMWEGDSARCTGVSRRVPWSECGDQAKWLYLARAAIEALREPMPSDAEVWYCPCCNQSVDREVMKKATIIDHALTEGE